MKAKFFTLAAAAVLLLTCSEAHAQWVDPYLTKTVDDDGDRLDVNADGSLTVGLPAGAATEATLASVDGKLPALVTEHNLNRVGVAMQGHPCPGNTTTTPLGAGATFTGDWEQILTYGVIVLNVSSDQDSAIDGIVVQHSNDGATVTDSDTYTLYAGETKVWRPPPSAQYYRVVYTNGATPQGTLSVVSTLRSGMGPNHAHRIKDSISEQDDAALALAVIAGETLTTPGTMQNVKTINGGSLMVSAESRDTSISRGLVPGHSPVWKFGYNGDVGAAWELVWEGSAVYDYLEAEETFKIKSDSVEDDTDKGGATPGTGAFTVEIQCINQAWAQVTQTVTLNGTAAVDLSTADCMIAYRMRVMSTGTGGYNAGTVTLYQNDGATAQLSITPGNNQSLISHMPVPLGQTLYVSYVNVSDVSSKISQVGIFVKEFGLPWQLKQTFSVSDSVVNRPTKVNFSVPARGIIAVRARTTGASGVVSVNFDGVLEAD